MRRGFLSLVLAVACFGFMSWIGLLSQVQAQDADLHATGYIPPTPEEYDVFVKTHPKIIKVLPNKTGYERINKARHDKGLAPLSEEGAATIQGDDLISVLPGKAPKKNFAAAT